MRRTLLFATAAAAALVIGHQAKANACDDLQFQQALALEPMTDCGRPAQPHKVVAKRGAVPDDPQWCQDNAIHLLAGLKDMFSDQTRLHGLYPVDLDHITTVAMSRSEHKVACHMATSWSNGTVTAGTFSIFPSKVNQDQRNASWDPDNQ